MKQLFILLVVLWAAECRAQAPEGKLFSAIVKFFKGGAAEREAATAARRSEGAAGTGLNPPPSSNVAQQVTPHSPPALAEPTLIPNAMPIASSHKELDAYNALQRAAIKGDTDAMIKMSQMTASGKVSDPALPYYGYWLIQATRAGSSAANKALQAECKQQEIKRMTDTWFDSACNSLDGKRLYAGRSTAMRIPLNMTYDSGRK